jgi:hypothetical protein
MYKALGGILVKQVSAIPDSLGNNRFTSHNRYDCPCAVFFAPTKFALKCGLAVGIHKDASAIRLPILHRPFVHITIRKRNFCEPCAIAAEKGPLSIRQYTSAYVSIRQHTSAYVSIRQHTSAYVCVRDRNLCDGRQETAPHTSRRRPLYTRRGPAQIGMSTSHILVYTAIDVSWYNCCICILVYTAIYEIGMNTTHILTYTATYVSSYISASAVI